MGFGSKCRGPYLLSLPVLLDVFISCSFIVDYYILLAVSFCSMWLITVFSQQLCCITKYCLYSKFTIIYAMIVYISVLLKSMQRLQYLISIRPSLSAFSLVLSKLSMKYVTYKLWFLGHVRKI